MIQSDDPFEREVRWLAHLEEDARLNERIVTKVAKFGGDARSFQERGAALRDFFQKIATKLPAGYHTLPGNPSVEAMLEDLGQTRIYPVYTLHAAYVHGSHASTWLYRKHLGTLKEAGEFIAADSWYLPLWTGWTSLQVLGSYVLERLGATTSDFVSPDQAAAIGRALNALEAE